MGRGPHRSAQLIAAGWAIDAHSLTHADLALASGAALTREISGSRREIFRLLGVLPRFFCYPAGRYDAETIAAVRAAGYEGATTTEAGLAGLASPDEPFTLARIRVDRGDGAAGVAHKLAGLELSTWLVSRGSGRARRP